MNYLLLLPGQLCHEFVGGDFENSNGINKVAESYIVLGEKLKMVQV